MFRIDKLDSIGDIVSAQLVGLKEIDYLLVLAHVEVPNSEDVFSQTMNRLICGDWTKISESSNCYCFDR
jgi:hypothetical protein